MTKAEARKMLRLEAENAELRDNMRRQYKIIREACAYRVAIAEILATIEEAKEFAK